MPEVFTRDGRVMKFPYKDRSRGRAMGPATLPQASHSPEDSRYLAQMLLDTGSGLGPKYIGSDDVQAPSQHGGLINRPEFSLAGFLTGQPIRNYLAPAMPLGGNPEMQGQPIDRRDNTGNPGTAFTGRVPSGGFNMPTFMRFLRNQAIKSKAEPQGEDAMRKARRGSLPNVPFETANNPERQSPPVPTPAMSRLRQNELADVPRQMEGIQRNRDFVSGLESESADFLEGMAARDPATRRQAFNSYMGRPMRGNEHNMLADRTTYGGNWASLGTPDFMPRDFLAEAEARLTPESLRNERAARARIAAAPPRETSHGGAIPITREDGSVVWSERPAEGGGIDEDRLATAQANLAAKRAGIIPRTPPNSFKPNDPAEVAQRRMEASRDLRKRIQRARAKGINRGMIRRGEVNPAIFMPQMDPRQVQANNQLQLGLAELQQQGQLGGDRNALLRQQMEQQGNLGMAGLMAQMAQNESRERIAGMENDPKVALMGLLAQNPELARNSRFMEMAAPYLNGGEETPTGAAGTSADSIIPQDIVDELPDYIKQEVARVGTYSGMPSRDFNPLDMFARPFQDAWGHYLGGSGESLYPKTQKIYDIISGMMESRQLNEETEAAIRQELRGKLARMKPYIRSPQSARGTWYNTPLLQRQFESDPKMGFLSLLLGEAPWENVESYYRGLSR